MDRAQAVVPERPERWRGQEGFCGIEIAPVYGEPKRHPQVVEFHLDTTNQAASSGPRRCSPASRAKAVNQSRCRGWSRSPSLRTRDVLSRTAGSSRACDIALCPHGPRG